MTKDIRKFNLIIVSGKAKTGNFIISINNAIIFCEIVRCKKLIIENKELINHPIFYQKYNFTIEPFESNYAFNSIDKDSLNIHNFFFYHLNYRFLRNINRFHVFRNEILNNIPKIDTYSEDLYIYIRSGDIFKKHNGSIITYAQPPLCFYKKIIELFKFREVFIISQDKLNPVIPLLIKNYSFIHYKKNKLVIDMSYLIYSYNLVSAKSSFFISLIKFNEKLKNLWEYNFYRLSERYVHLHHSVYAFPYN